MVLCSSDIYSSIGFPEMAAGDEACGRNCCSATAVVRGALFFVFVYASLAVYNHSSIVNCVHDVNLKEVGAAELLGVQSLNAATPDDVMRLPGVKEFSLLFHRLGSEEGGPELA